MNEQTDIRAIAADLAPPATDDGTGSGIEGVSLRRFVGEWLALTAVIAAANLALGAEAGNFATLGIVVAYWLSGYVVRWRQPKRPKRSWQAHLTDFYATLYVTSSAAIVWLLLLIIVVTWMWAAYDHRELDVLQPSVGPVATAALSLLFLFGLIYLGPLAMLRRRGTLSGSLRGFVWWDVTHMPRSPLWLGFAGSMWMIGLLATAIAAHGFEALVEKLSSDREANLLDAAAMFPMLPLGLLASTALLTLYKGPMWHYTENLAAATRAHMERGAGLPAWQSAVTAAASVPVVVAILYPIHFALVLGLSSVPGLTLGHAANEAVTDWIAAERGKGLGGDEIAVLLNRHGRWTADAPETGLGALLPDLGAKLADEGGNCEIAVAAAAIGPAGADTAHCIRAACPSPVRWPAPPALTLYSSHASQNAGWRQTVFFDVHADGVAATPGGYCTADGRLASDFQG